MTWPDPNCNKSHEPGAVYRRWEHTPDCNRHAPAKIHKEKRVTEVHKQIEMIRPEPAHVRYD